MEEKQPKWRINKKYKGYSELVSDRALNGYVDLEGIKLTKKQVEDLRKFIENNWILSISIRDVSLYHFEFVDDVKEGNLPDHP